MESLAFIVSIIFLILLISGPTSLILARNKYYLLSIPFIILSIFSGIHWVKVLSTSARYLGLIPITFALLSIYYLSKYKNEKK